MMDNIFICVVCALALCCLAEELPAVKTKVGKITGLRENTNFQGKQYAVDRYLGIPYAKPPVGNLRFKKPEPHSPFVETFHAEKFGPACVQFDWMGLIQNTSEDCLSLNIFIPVQDPDQSTGHAVLVFMHGGGFSVGEAAMYPGDILAAVGNVIVVTINYRLGLLGFLDLDDPRAPGNFGLWDQHQSLVWVNENIASFGGDKNRVTIFGQSAGSVAVQHQSIYPKNRELFRGVIAQSGSLTISQTVTSPLNHKEAGNFYAEKIGCKTDTVDHIFECLVKATPESITDVMKNAAYSGSRDEITKTALFPSIDGEFMKYHPTDLYKRARNEHLAEIEFLRSLKLINGITGNDGLAFVQASDDMQVTRQEMNSQHIPSIASLIFNPPIPEAVTELLISEYTD
ncbi:putative inactive carboxylesterase 4 [Mercenaria mercenaria]|uniref:putative inactive carboxylesterase 4 n=1 Tax=Mercenaria mercenaria TaxID=6596 RepID=UPI00234EFBB4|nr:putative inactive carboxylesterase 4 [Mercenaria mercenaria]